MTTTIPVPYGHIQLPLVGRSTHQNIQLNLPSHQEARIGWGKRVGDADFFPPKNPTLYQLNQKISALKNKLLGYTTSGFVVDSWFLIADSEEKKSVVQLFRFEFQKKSESPEKLDVQLFKQLGYLILSPQDMYRISIDHTESSKGYVSYFFSTSQFQIWSFHCLDWAGDSNDAEEQPGPRVQELNGSNVNRKSQQQEETVTSGTSIKKRKTKLLHPLSTFFDL